MTSKQHPEIEQLWAYVEEPESPEFNSTRLHIAACQECRFRVSRLNTILHHLRSIYVAPSNREDTWSLQQISAYVNGTMAADEQKAFQRLLETNPALLKQALYFATQSAGLQRQAVAAKRWFGLFTGTAYIRAWIKNRAFPAAWIGVSASAAALVMIVILTVPFVIKKEHNTLSVASYQDNPVMTFSQSQSPPGIGFFATAKSTQKPYSGVNVAIDARNRLHLSWPAVAGARAYTIRLYKLKDKERILVGTGTGSATQTVIGDYVPEIGRRFEWELSGLTNNSINFNAIGGFVITASK